MKIVRVFFTGLFYLCALIAFGMALYSPFIPVAGAIQQTTAYTEGTYYAVIALIFFLLGYFVTPKNFEL